MTAEHFDAILRELHDQRPFRIFTVQLFSGRRFEVDHPRALSARDGMAVFLAPGGAPIIFDHNSVSEVIAGPASAAETPGPLP